MRTRVIEAVSDSGNYGKFLVGQFDHEYDHRDQAGYAFIGPRWGYYPDGHIMVFDLETGEGGLFRPGGMAKADLRKHSIWVCPLFELALAEIYKLWTGKLDELPAVIELTEIPLQLRGYRRPGPVPEPLAELAKWIEDQQDGLERSSQNLATLGAQEAFAAIRAKIGELGMAPKQPDA